MIPHYNRRSGMGNESVLGNMKLIKYLSQEGYYFTMNPDRDYTPLTVVQVPGTGSPKALGLITAFMTNLKEQLPKIQTESKAILSGEEGSDADASIELGTSDLLSKALKFIFNLKAEITYQGIDSVSLNFNNVTSDSIVCTGLTKYLDGVIVTENKLNQTLCKKGNNCLIIYDTLKSDDILISFKKNGEASSKTDIKFLLDSAGVSGSGKFGQKDAGTIQYKGKEPLTFALKGIGFHIEKSGWINRVTGVDFELDSSRPSSKDLFAAEVGTAHKPGRKPMVTPTAGPNIQEKYSITIDKQFRPDPYQFL